MSISRSYLSITSVYNYSNLISGILDVEQVTVLVEKSVPQGVLCNLYCMGNCYQVMSNLEQQFNNFINFRMFYKV